MKSTTSHLIPPVAAIALCLLVADSAVLARGLTNGWSAGSLMGAHFCVVAPVATWLLRSRYRSNPHAALLAIAAAAFGPLGPTGVLFALALERHHAGSATSIDAWHQTLFPPTGPDAQGDLWRRIGQRATDRTGDQRVTPFLDVLAFGSVQQRQAVVAIVAQQFRPAFAPALKAALRDEHNVIRVQAATVIAGLEQGFLERTMALEAKVAEQPDDADAILALAQHCDDQAFAGVLDATREERCRARAADGYARYLTFRPDDLAAELRLARLQLRRGSYDEAEPRLRRLAQAGDRNARLWLLETLYAQQRFADLRETAARFDGTSDESLPFEAVAAMQLWAGHGVRA